MQRGSHVGDIKLSKALSWILRHGAIREGIAISDDGYISLNAILNHASFSKYTVSDILRVVETNNKQRFSLRKHPVSDEFEIKANQGHSIKVPDIDLRPLECNDSTVVVHGTYLRNWDRIKEEGLNRMTRNHIHFACGEPVDANVISGIRHNCEVYIYVNAKKLLEDGIPLYVSPNQVILCPGNDKGIIHPKYFKEVKFFKPKTRVLKAEGGIFLGLFGSFFRPKVNRRKKIIQTIIMYCEVCNAQVSDGQTWASHVAEEQHRNSLKEINEGTGIFIRGFDKSLHQNYLKSFFKEFGEIEHVFLNKKQMFAIVEFCDRKSADLVLSREIFLQGRRLKIVRRRGKPRVIKKETKAMRKDETIFEIESPALELMPDPPTNSFDEEAVNFVKKIEAKGMENKVNIVCESLEKAFAPHFRGCRIYAFGSNITGLATNDSDVDVFVDLFDMQLPGDAAFSSSDAVMKARAILKKNYEFSKCIAIPKAKVPIVKCFHRYTKLNCDINFENALGIQNSYLIKYYISLQPRLRTILMIIKYWAKTNQLSGPGNLTSYSLVMLLFYYVQQMTNPILPTVEKLQSLCGNIITIHGWKCHFQCDVKDLDPIVNNFSILSVLEGFFSFYSKFNFAENVILLNTATAIPKASFGNPPKNSLCHQYHLALEMANAMPPKLDKVMCVMDPFVLNHNITGSLGMKGLNQFQIRCYKAADICQRIGNGGNLHLKTLFTEESKPKRIKFPYLEHWKTSGEVKIIIPQVSFNPKKSFKCSKLKPNNDSDSGKLELLMEHIKDIFEKVMHFKLVRCENNSNPSGTEKQVQKVEGMEDVHASSASKVLEPFTIVYCSFFHIWKGRNLAYKEFNFPNNMELMEREMHVTNYIVDTFYKKIEENIHKIDLKCIFVPIMDYRCLELEIVSCDKLESFRPMIIFLLTILHKWLEK